MRSFSYLLSLCLAVSLLAALPASGAGTVRAMDSAQANQTHKVIAGPGVLDPAQPGVSLWHDYGAFALYRVSDAALARVTARSQAGAVLADDMDRILIDAQPFDSQRDTLRLPATLSLAQADGPALHLVQFVGPIQDAWLEQVKRAGATPVHYIANNAYLVWAGATARTALDRMAEQKDFLQYSALYQPYFKLGASLRERVEAGSDPDEVVPVVVQMYRHAGRAATEQVVRDTALEVLSPWSPILAYQNIIVRVRAGDIARLAQLPDVNWIGERFERELMDESQGQILAGNMNFDQSGPSGPGYLAWLNSYGFSTNPADYPIIDICDDGIGGNSAPTQPTNTPTNDVTLDPRVIFRNSCNASYPNDGRGLDGHGHINASIAVGMDTRTGSPYQDSNGYNRGLGINPYGRVGGTRIFGGSYDISLCGGTDTGVIAANYRAGALISSNSWGCSSCAGTYDESSQAYDAGVRDADLSAAGNQQLIYIFSAGNSGSSSGTVGTPGNGKNMITVGASENDRPTWTDGCGIGPTGADDAMDVISFSSRGPAPGGRVKPELIAPGTHIQGTASTHPNYNGSGVCDQYLPSGQTVFAASSGTSHSTPAVAGVASLYYYWLGHTYGMATPSPAMMKAYLIAHPTYLTGVSANDTLPSNSQGYGMPNMALAFDDTPRYMVDQSVTLDDSGDTWTFQGAVADPSRPLRIVLAYTDQAGAIGTSPQVNNLNLAASVGGSLYLGNRFTGQWSTTGGTPDSKNNYEAVFLPAGTSGALEITVTGFNIAGDGIPNVGDTTDQDFALVCYNCAQHPDFTLLATPATLDVCAPDEPVYDVQVDSIMGYTDPVDLSLQGAPAGTTPLFGVDPVVPPGTSVLTITNTGAAAYGSYTLSIVGTAPTKTHTATLGLNLFTAAPGTVSLSAPADGAQDLPTRPSFSWSAPAQAGTYGLEIATDNLFANVVHSATALPGTAYVPSVDLNTGMRYYWRVWAENACGAGAYSAAFSFTTLPAPGDCGLDRTPVTLFVDHFESGTAGWTHGGTQDTWTLSGARVRSGSYAFYATDLSSVSDQRLVAPAVTLPIGQSPLTLQFWNHQTIESRTGGCYDGAIVEISTNGTDWTQLLDPVLLTDPYDGPVSTSYSNPLGGLDAWCGNPQDWLKSVVSLDDYAGQTVQFRFRLGTDSSVGKEGWYIDDVVVQSCTLAGYSATLAGSTVETTPNTAVTHAFTLTNRGLSDAYTLTVAGGTWPVTLLTASPLALGSGESAVVTARVDVPDLLPLLSASDAFTLTATSVNSPTVAVAARGTTEVLVTPEVVLKPATLSRSGDLGETVTFTFTVENTGNYTDTFALLLSGQSWNTAVPASTGALAAGASADVLVQVTIPDDPALQAVILASDTFTLTATSALDGAVSTQAVGTTHAMVHPSVALDPAAQSLDGVPGSVVNHTFTLTNTGDYTDTFSLNLSGAAWASSAPASAGPLRPGASLAVQVQVTVPATLPPLDDAFTLQARSNLDSMVTAQGSGSTHADVHPGLDLSLEPPLQTGAPGDVLTYTVTLTNTGDYTDTFSLGLSGQQWDVAAPSSSGPLAAGDSLEVAVRVSIPSALPLRAALIGSDTFTLTATSGLDAGISGQVSATSRAEVTPGVALEPSSQALHGVPGATVVYTLRVTNTGTYTDTLVLTYTAGAWQIQVPVMQARLGAGAAADLQVEVQVPADAIGGATDSTAVTVYSQLEPAQARTANLTTTADNVYGVVLAPTIATLAGTAGQAVTYTLSLSNTGNVTDTIHLARPVSGWPTTFSASSLDLAPGQSSPVQVYVTPPLTVTETAYDTAVIRATGSGGYAEVTLTTTIEPWQHCYLPLVLRPLP